ncbi:MAG TPA: adenylate/guanylate cyclase domain-containing protein [Streptosporangiaceae bacterium]
MNCAHCDAVLAADARFCSRCGNPTISPGAPRESRRTVTILFMDLVESTALGARFDPEAMRQILDRYRWAARSCVEAHGGATEKFIGDAVMAVFGAEVSHEDDALRAVRTALDTLAKVSELNVDLMSSHRVALEVRSGICSGEVMATINPGGDVWTVGGPNNIAARLQTLAKPGQILVDQVTASLVKASVALEPTGLLQVKGIPEPLPAWRVVGLKLGQDLITDSPAVPLIGRDDDLDGLHSAYQRVQRRNRPSLVTVLGDPGIGKSRLIRDFVASLLPGATVLTGRCSAYGRGITYKPLAEMLNGYGGGWASVATAIEPGGAEARRATDCLSGIALDNPDLAGEPTGIEEISWSVRYLLGQLSRTSPVIMIWEDLHLAEPTLLDMVDDVISWLTDVPVMLICVSRSDLLETRPTWGRGQFSSWTLELSPLSLAQCAELVAELAVREEVTAHQQEAICERVVADCEGNPLFVEQMLDLFAETGPGRRVPATISAVLTARLDQLSVDERRLLEVASVIGREFCGTTLTALLTADRVSVRQAEEILAQLVRRRFLVRVSSDSFRFEQLLMHENAYQCSPKATRERLHLLLAAQLARLLGDGGGDGDFGVQDPMVLVHHVEGAIFLRRELRPGSADLPELASQTAAILISEGTKALHRRDLPGAAALLDRARRLISADDERQIQLMLYISDCLSMREPAQAIEALLADDPEPRFDIVARIQRSLLELRMGTAPPEAFARIADQIECDLADTAENDRAWCRLYQLKAHLNLVADRYATAQANFQLALERARRLRDGHEEDRLLVGICEIAPYSPIDVASGLRLCAEMSERFSTNRALLVPVLLPKAVLSALGDDLAGARAALSEAVAHTSDLHLPADLYDVLIMGITALVDSLAGEYRLAAAGYRRARDLLLELGRAPQAAPYTAYLARALFDQGAPEAAERALRQLRSETRKPDPRTEVIATSLEARLAARAGRLKHAVELAAGSAALSEQADDLCLQGNSYLDLAIVAKQAGQPETARQAGATAIDRYRAKGATRLIAAAGRALDGNDR